jgi:serine/threonine protein kinase
LSRRISETSKTFIKYQVVLAEVSLRFVLQLFILGAYGEVRKCLHKETKALRAVKIINKKYLAEEEKAKLMNEIDILK